jgi:hypothetical protein
VGRDAALKMKLIDGRQAMLNILFVEPDPGPEKEPGERKSKREATRKSKQWI